MIQVRIFFSVYSIQGVMDFCEAMNVSEMGSPKDLTFANWVTTHYGNGVCLDYDYVSRVDKLINSSLSSPAIISGGKKKTS